LKLSKFPSRRHPLPIVRTSGWLPCALGPGQHLLFAVNQIAGIEGGQLKSVAVGDGVGGAGLHTITAEYASIIVDVIDLRVALGAGNALLGGVFGGLDIDAVRGAGGGAEETGDAFFQSVFVALQDVHARKRS